MKTEKLFRNKPTEFKNIFLYQWPQIRAALNKMNKVAPDKDIDFWLEFKDFIKENKITKKNLPKGRKETFKNYLFKFGKFKGWSIDAVAKKNSDYLAWLEQHEDGTVDDWGGVFKQAKLMIREWSKENPELWKVAQKEFIKKEKEKQRLDELETLREEEEMKLLLQQNGRIYKN